MLVDLLNTTPAGVGGFLTGFLMNNPDTSKVTGISAYTTTTSFAQIGLSADGAQASPRVAGDRASLATGEHGATRAVGRSLPTLCEAHDPLASASRANRPCSGRSGVCTVVAVCMGWIAARALSEA